MEKSNNRKRKRGLIAIVAGAFSAGVFGIWALWCLGIIGMPEASGQVRVERARKDKHTKIERMFREAGVGYPPEWVFIRVFKLEMELELWALGRNQQEFKPIKTYPICYVPGKLGPKRREGDNQVPEGIYRVDRFNPQSKFHLSLGLDYPNRADRILGHPSHPGGDIFVHGECVSIGCIPIQNHPIEELYLISLDSKLKSSRAPAVHIFPCRMDRCRCQEQLKSFAGENDDLSEFWQDLEKIYDHFQKEQKLPEVEVDAGGRYVIK